MGQQGSVLIISLVFLLIMTITGLITINSSSLEVKVSGNSRDQKMAFQVGEAALLMAENYIDSATFNMTKFTSSCNKGLCFSGTDRDNVFNCNADAVSPWEEAGLWSDNLRVKAVTVKLKDKEMNAWYIIEFRCYVSLHDDGQVPNFGNSRLWSEYYRITARANGDLGNSKVMLQSTYIK